MAAHAIVVLLWKAHERLPAPQREKHTDGQYERNAQEGRLVSLFSAPNCFSNLRGRALRSPHVMRLSLPQTFANRHQRLAQTVQLAAIRAHSLHCESFVRILSGVVTALYEPRDTATSSEYRAP
jgi:hypothetical protein